MTEPARRQVLIIGGGFAGLQAAKSLRKADADVTLIDRRNFHLFQPLLYQVATGDLSPANIATPLRGLLRGQPNAHVILGEVTDIDVAAKVITTTDMTLPFDDLILAAGATHHYFGNDHWAKFAPGLKTIENATEIRRQILGAFEAAERCSDSEQVRELLTFVIVGGGPTGCELAGTLAEISRHTLGHDFRRIDPTQARIILVDSGAAPINYYPKELTDRAEADLKGLGVQLVQNSRVTDVHPTHVIVTSKHTGEQTRIDTRTVIWAAGVKGSFLGERLCASAGIQPERGGRVRVNEDLSVAGHPNIFVTGDLAFFDYGEQGLLPGLAPVATQMGQHTAKCILADLAGKPRQSFRYHDRGSMAVIGRYSAVGMIGNWKVKGIVAWVLWLTVHLMYIAMFRNRLLILTQWGWTFLTHDRSARLITDGPGFTIASMGQSTGWDEDPAMPKTAGETCAPQSQDS